MNRSDHEYIKYVLERELEYFTTEEALRQALVPQFADRFHGPVFCLLDTSRRHLKMDLVIPTVSYGVIEVLGRMTERYSIFDDNLRVERVMGWTVDHVTEIDHPKRREDCILRGGIGTTKRCRCGVEIPGNTLKCIPCVELDSFKASQKRKHKAAVDLLYQLCLVSGAALWQQTDDTSKRFMMLEFT